LHGWAPKLAARYFNMNLNNAYKLYCVIYKMVHPGRKEMPLKECIHNLTHSLLQRGDPMWRRDFGARPSATKDITTSTSVDGRSIRSDSVIQPFSSPGANGTGGTHARTPQSSLSGVDRSTVYKQKKKFRKLVKQLPGRRHQSLAMVLPDKVYCKYCRRKASVAMEWPTRTDHTSGMTDQGQTSCTPYE